jgi:hypothetical protein
MLITLMRSAPSSAGMNPLTVNAMLKRPASQAVSSNMSALSTRVNNPSVSS